MPNKTLTLSIVIPVYNEQDYLSPCLDAIAAQNEKPEEVIVVDNGSSDRTVEIAQSYPFVKLIQVPQKHRSLAQKIGFDAASSELIGRIDADTIIAPDWIACAKNLFRQSGSKELFAVSAPSSFRNRFGSLWYVMHRLTYFWPCRLLMGHSTLVGSNMIMTKRLWLLVFPHICLRDDFHEDMDLAFHAAKLGAEMSFSSELKASILGRKMVRRAVVYPMMMFRVLTAPEHLVLRLKQSVDQQIASPKYYPPTYEE